MDIFSQGFEFPTHSLNANRAFFNYHVCDTFMNFLKTNRLALLWHDHHRATTLSEKKIAGCTYLSK